MNTNINPMNLANTIETLNNVAAGKLEKMETVLPYVSDPAILEKVLAEVLTLNESFSRLIRILEVLRLGAIDPNTL